MIHINVFQLFKVYLFIKILYNWEVKNKVQNKGRKKRKFFVYLVFMFGTLLYTFWTHYIHLNWSGGVKGEKFEGKVKLNWHGRETKLKGKYGINENCFQHSPISQCFLPFYQNICSKFLIFNFYFKFYVFWQHLFWKIPYCKGYIKSFLLFLFFSLFIRVVLFVLFILYIHCLKKDFFAYICNIIGLTPDDDKVFGEIYWEENDIILVLESRVGICLKTI